MSKNTSSFRLSTTKAKSTTYVFESSRIDFRAALASSVIDLRLREPGAPMKLEIGRAEGKGVTWVGLPKKHFPGGTLPELIRWECAVDFYDYLNRELERGKDEPPRQARETSTWV